MFDMFEIDFYTFNLLEGVFWVALSFVVVFFILQEIPKRYQFLGAFTGATLFVFGVSDFFEAYFGQYMYRPQEWLFAIKVFILTGQVAAIVWYIRLRIKDGEDGLFSPDE